MTSRERVKKTFGMERADRMPIDYSGNGGINDRLLKHFNTDYEGVLTALNVDFRGVAAPYTGKKLFPEKEGMSLDGVYGVYAKWIEHATGGYWDYGYFPLSGASDDEIANYPVPSPDDFDYGAAVERMKAFGDKAVYVGHAGICDIINCTGRAMGMEQTLVNLITEDEATLTYINRRCEMELECLRRTIEKGKGRVDFIWMGEDLGTQIAPMVSLELYRKVMRPIHQRYVDIGKHYKLPVMVHTCGSSSWAYDDFIEMGVRAVDTLQPEAANMNPAYLIKRFGGRLCFHGSISTAGPLAYGSPADVERDVKEKCALYRPTNSYMISPTHQIQDNSPLENVLRMYESALKYGKY